MLRFLLQIKSYSINTVGHNSRRPKRKSVLRSIELFSDTGFPVLSAPRWLSGLFSQRSSPCFSRVHSAFIHHSDEKAWKTRGQNRGWIQWRKRRGEADGGGGGYARRLAKVGRDMKGAADPKASGPRA